MKNEPLWKKESTVTQPESVPLVIEVVSTNWRDDYHKKYADYEEMRIPEYWIADYVALGARMILLRKLDIGEVGYVAHEIGMQLLRR